MLAFLCHWTACLLIALYPLSPVGSACGLSLDASERGGVRRRSTARRVLVVDLGRPRRRRPPALRLSSSSLMSARTRPRRMRRIMSQHERRRPRRRARAITTKPQGPGVTDVRGRPSARRRRTSPSAACARCGERGVHGCPRSARERIAWILQPNLRPICEPPRRADRPDDHRTCSMSATAAPARPADAGRSAVIAGGRRHRGRAVRVDRRWPSLMDAVDRRHDGLHRRTTRARSRLASRSRRPPGHGRRASSKRRTRTHGVVGWKVVEFPASDLHPRAFRESFPTRRRGERQVWSTPAG